MIVEKIYEDRVSEAEKSARRSKHLTASIISACRRQNYYRIKAFVVKGDPDADLLMILEEGNLHHLAIVKLIREIATRRPDIRIVDVEFGVTCRDIYARVDFSAEIEGVLWNVEFKSMSDDVYPTFERYGVQAFPSHYAQCQVIAGSKPIRPMLVLAKNRNNGALAEEEVKPDWDFIENLANVKTEFDKNLEQSKAPTRDFGYNSVECKGCEFRFRCWFSKLRNEVAVEADLDKKELGRIEAFRERLRSLRPQADEYASLEQVLLDYVALLHKRYAVRKIRLDGVRSTFVHFSKQIPNTSFIRSVLSNEDLELAFRESEVVFYKTTIDL